MNDMPSPLKINLCLLKVRVKIAFLIFTDVKKKKVDFFAFSVWVLIYIKIVLCSPPW